MRFIKHLIFALVFISCSSEQESNSSNSNESAQQSKYSGNKNQEENGSGFNKDSERDSNMSSGNSTSFSGDFTYSSEKLIDFSSYQPMTQKFKIDGSRDTIIKSGNGNKFYLPAFCFKDENGKIQKADIEISLIEYNHYFDFMTGNLSTNLSAGSLETGGMFHISAKSKGKALALREYHEIILKTLEELPEDMKMYYGKRLKGGEMKWEEDEFSREPFPVMQCMSGKYCGVSQLFFEEYFRFEKGKMVEMIGKYLELIASFDDRGKVIGRSNCKKEDQDFKLMACERFNEIVHQLNDSIPNTFPNKWNNEFKFIVKKRKSFKDFMDSLYTAKMKVAIELENERMIEEVSAALGAGKKLNEFSSEKQKLYFIQQMGNCNIDRRMLPKGDEGMNLIADISGWSTKVKLAGCKSKFLLEPIELKNHQFAFAYLPENEPVAIYYCYQDGGKMYLSYKKLITGELERVTNQDFQREEIASIEEMKDRVSGFFNPVAALK